MTVERRKTKAKSKAIMGVLFFDKTAHLVKERIEISKHFQTGLIASTKALFSKRKDDNKALYGELVGNESAVGKSRVNVLKKDPFNIAARLDLIEPYVNQDANCNLSKLKEVYNNALFAANQETLSSRSINYALLAQKAILQKAKTETTEEGKKIKEKIDEVHVQQGQENRQLEKQLMRQYKERVELLNYFNECIRVLPARKAPKDTQINFTDFLLSEEEATGTSQGAKENMITMNNILKGAIYLPPLNPRVLEIAEGIQKKYSQKPLGFYYKARLYKINAVLAEAAFRKEKKTPSGSVNPEKLLARQKDYINRSLKNITNAIKLVPELPQDQLEISCIEEYGVILLELNRMFPTVNMFDQLKKAVPLLGNIISNENKEQITQIQDRLNQILDGV